jgi:hypothetical protein
MVWDCVTSRHAAVDTLEDGVRPVKALHSAPCRPLPVGGEAVAAVCCSAVGGCGSTLMRVTWHVRRPALPSCVWAEKPSWSLPCCCPAARSPPPPRPRATRATQTRNSPLYYAARYGHVAIAEMLVERGADVNLACHDGLTPLMAAAMADRLDVATFLIGRGANVRMTDNYSRGPLILAAMAGSLTTVRLLLTHGAPVGAVDEVRRPLRPAYLPRPPPPPTFPSPLPRPPARGMQRLVAFAPGVRVAVLR